MAESKNKSSTGMRLAVGASAVLVVAGLLAFWYASNKAREAAPGEGSDVVTVTIEDRVCKPNDITVPAGRTTFKIVNNSDRALEWEILDGVMVVEERENIAPGFSSTMTVKLKPGEYDITCGLLSNPRGKLRVTPSADSDAEDKRPPATAFIGALAEYRVYLITQTSGLQKDTQALADAIAAGDRDKARALYAPAHQRYQRIEAMADMYSDLDQRINPVAAYLEKREADQGFTGFHRIEQGLFGDDSGDVKALKPVAEQLLADLGQLRERLRSLDIPADRLASASAKLLRRTADNLPAGASVAYSHSEASDLQGTLEGTRKLVGLLSPLLAKASPDLNKAVEAGFERFSAALDPYREGEGFRSGTLDEAQRKTIAEAIAAQADTLDQVNVALGLD